MIHEAMDAADSVIRALLLWIVLAAAVGTTAGFALLAAGWAVWRATVAAVKAVCAWLSWRHTAEVPQQAPPEGAPSPGVTQARPAPAWARTEEEAA